MPADRSNTNNNTRDRLVQQRQRDLEEEEFQQRQKLLEQQEYERQQRREQQSRDRQFSNRQNYPQRPSQGGSVRDDGSRSGSMISGGGSRIRKDNDVNHKDVR